MKSRIVRPVNRRGQTNRKKKSRVSGETQPMRPVGQSTGRSRLSDTQPMQPVRVRTAGTYTADPRAVDPRMTDERAVNVRAAGSRSGYSKYQNAYRQTIERRRQVLRTPQPREENGKARPAARVKKSGVSSLMAGRKSKTGAQEMYFDYDLLLVIVFLMCFGLVMLYSTSAVSYTHLTLPTILRV